MDKLKEYGIGSIVFDPCANTDAKDKRGYTPLLISCKNNHTTVVTTLLDKGADINYQDKKGGHTSS